MIEGHVPASAVWRLLREKPSAKGFAVPGMPVILCGYTNHANAARMLADADGAFVGTCLEREGWGGSIDIERVREYVAIVNSLR